MEQMHDFRVVSTNYNCYSASLPKSRACFKIVKYFSLQCCLNCFHFFSVEKHASGFTLLERDVNVKLSCFSVRFSYLKIAKYFCLQCCLNCFTLLEQGIQSCIAVLFFSALIMLKDCGFFVSSVLSCFHLFPVEKRD